LICLFTDARNKSGYVTLKNLLKEIGGWPLIDDNWDYKYDWINALIVLNRLLGNEIKLFLTISVEPYFRNTSRSLIQVNFNNYIMLKVIIFVIFLKITHPFVKPKENLVGIYTHPENLKITSYYGRINDFYYSNLEGIEELLRGFPINESQRNLKYNENQIEEAIRNVEKKIYEVVSNHYNSRLITVQQLNHTYKGIDWMRLLNGVFKDTNIEIKPDDLVEVKDHQYLLQLSNVIFTQTKE
jgi:hypothetical protein